MKRTHLIALVVLLAGWLMPVAAPVVSVAAADLRPAVVADDAWVARSGDRPQQGSPGGATTNGWTDPVGG